MSETLQVYLLGEFRLYREGVFISPKDWHTRQARQLFKVLLTEYGHVVSMRKLMNLLWPEHSESAYKTLRSAISTLRTVLEPDRDPHALSRFIPRGNTGYTLVFPPDVDVWIDAREFERRLDEALATPVQNSPERRELLEEALRLYTGDYLAEDEEESWAWAERIRLRERYFVGASSLMNWQHAAGLYAEAIAVGHQALKLDPCREPFYRMIMQCQAQQGDCAGALQTFERCRQVLDECLAADPAPQTLKLHTMILQGTFPAPVLSTTVGNGTARRETGPGRAAKRRDEPTCIGRKRELTWFGRQLQELQTQTPRQTRTVAVVGEAGVGKSFLVRLFLQRAREAGASVMMAQCQAIEQNVSFAPLVSMLNAWLLEASDEQIQMLPRAELAHIAPLLPGLAARLPRDALRPVSASVNPEQAYSALIAGLVDIFAALSQQGPLILAWDDLQWADESTLLVINRLACLERAALLLVISYRPEDLSENEPLDRMLRYLRRGEGTSTLPLSRFSPTEVAEYLALHQATPPLQAETLYQTTQGNALFLVEAVRTLLEQKRARQSEDLAAVQVDEAIDSVLQSERIHDVVLARVARLPECAAELLKIAAVIGRPFSLDLLRPRLSEDDYQALNILLARRFLVEVEPNRDYEIRLAFSHEMVGQIIAASCSALQLRQLHQHVADQLVRRYAPNTEAHAAEIAFHYRRCGAAFECQVVRYEVEAGDYARRTFSYRQALIHYDAALQLLPHLAHEQDQRRMRECEEWARRAYAGRALVYEALMDWEGIQESYRHLGNGPGSRKDPVQSGSSARRVAGIRSLMGHLSEAADMGLSAIQRLRAETGGLNDAPDGTRKSVSALIDMTQRWASLLKVERVVAGEVAGQAEDFPAFHAAAPPLIRDWYEMIDVLEPSQAALTLVEYGWALLLQGFTSDAEHCLKAALQAAEETDQVTYWVLGAMHLSRVYHLYGQQEESQRWFELCIERGKRASEATWSVIWPLLNKAYSLTAQNQLDEAEQLLRMLYEQIEQQGDFLAHRYSTQIGFGLVALARGKVERAEELLQEALAHPRYLYIEAYVLAELGLVHVMRQQGRNDEAVARLRNILAFCGQRSLLEHYASTALTLARLSLHIGQVQGLLPLLEQVSQHVAGAGYTVMHRQCRELLARVSAAIG